MFLIRKYQKNDLEALYDVCVKTADAGEDASDLYEDPTLIGKLYAAPYALLEPELCFVLEDDAGVCGYILGAFDSELFYERFVAEWLPKVLPSYENPKGAWDDLSLDEQRIRQLYEFASEAHDNFEGYPSHLHIDLLARAQKKGQGKRLMNAFLEALREKGSVGVHLGMMENNDNAYAFYKHLGFGELERSEGAIFMGMKFV